MNSANHLVQSICNDYNKNRRTTPHTKKNKNKTKYQPIKKTLRRNFVLQSCAQMQKKKWNENKLNKPHNLLMIDVSLMYFFLFHFDSLSHQQNMITSKHKELKVWRWRRKKQQLNSTRVNRYKLNLWMMLEYARLRSLGYSFFVYFWLIFYFFGSYSYL